MVLLQIKSQALFKEVKMAQLGDSTSTIPILKKISQIVVTEKIFRVSSLGGGYDPLLL